MARRSSSSIVSAGLVLIAMLLAVFVVQPLRTTVDGLAQDVMTKQSELALIETETAALVEQEATLPQADSERTKLLAAVPEGLNQDDLVETLVEIAEDADVSLNSISFSLQSSEANEAQVISTSLSLTGDYTALDRLLKSLESSDRLLSIQSLGVQLGDVTEEGYTMSFSLSVNAYYQN